MKSFSTGEHLAICKMFLRLNTIKIKIDDTLIWHIDEF